MHNSWLFASNNHVKGSLLVSTTFLLKSFTLSNFRCYPCEIIQSDKNMRETFPSVTRKGSIATYFANYTAADTDNRTDQETAKVVSCNYT